MRQLRPGRGIPYTLSGFVREEAVEPGAPVCAATVCRCDGQRPCLARLPALPGSTRTDRDEDAFEVVASEAAADEAPMDDDELDVLVGSKKFSPLELIEDESAVGFAYGAEASGLPVVHESLVTGADGG
jgi:uncharacterized protein